MKKNLLVVVFAFLIAGGLFAQDMKVLSLPKYYASCIFNFSRYVNWPADSKSGDFNIAVVGDKKVFEELQTLATGKSVGSQAMNVKYYKSVDELADFNHIVYLADWTCGNISKLTSKIGSKSTLVVCEREGMVKSGAAFDFVNVDGLMKFEMAKNTIEKSGLQVSSSLERMAYRSN